MESFIGCSTVVRSIKNVLVSVCNCVGEQALHCERVASSYVCQPNHSYLDFMFRLHGDVTCAIVIADILHSGWSTKLGEYPTVLSIACGHTVFIKSFCMHRDRSTMIVL